MSFIEVIDASRWVYCVRNNIEIDVQWQKAFDILNSMNTMKISPFVQAIDSDTIVILGGDEKKEIFILSVSTQEIKTNIADI